MSHDWDKGEPEHDCHADERARPQIVVERIIRIHTVAAVMAWVVDARDRMIKEEQDRVAAADKAKRDALLKRIEDGRAAQRQLDRMNGKDV